MTEHERDDYIIPPTYAVDRNGATLAASAESLAEWRGYALEEPPGEGRRVMLANVDALETIELLSATMTPAEMRRRASLVLRCADCAGRVVGWATWVEGRPLFVGEHGPRRVMVSLLDVPEFAAPEARCRVRSWRFMGEMPGPGARTSERRLRHTDETVVL